MCARVCIHMRVFLNASAPHLLLRNAVRAEGEQDSTYISAFPKTLLPTF